jgi:hypothetical protein
MFIARLFGANEVPPVTTNAQGIGCFSLSQDRQSLEFRLKLCDVTNVVVAHLHLAPAGVNGPVVAFLFGPLTNAVSIEFAIFTGAITQSDLIGPLAGHSLEDLVNEICAGNIYANVHTVQNPSGEIRGQLGFC